MAGVLWILMRDWIDSHRRAWRPRHAVDLMLHWLVYCVGMNRVRPRIQTGVYVVYDTDAQCAPLQLYNNRRIIIFVGGQGRPPLHNPFFYHLSQSRISHGLPIILHHVFYTLGLSHDNHHLLCTGDGCVKQIACVKYRYFL